MLFIVCTILLLISLITISSVTYFSIINYVLGKMDGYLSSNLLQTSSMLRNNLSQIEGLTLNIANDNALAEMITAYNSTSNSNLKVQTINEINSYLTKLERFNSSISGIVVLTEQTAFYTGYTMQHVFYNITSKSLNGTRYRSKLLQSPDRPAFFTPVKAEEEPTSNTSMDILKDKYSYGCIISGNGEELGAVFIAVKPNIFDQVFKENQNFTVLDEDNNVLWQGSEITSQDTQFIRENLGRNNLTDDVYKLTSNHSNVYVSNLFSNNWRVVSFLKVSSISGKISSINFFFLVALIASALLAFVFSRIISARITRPISSLLERIRKYRLKASDTGSAAIVKKPGTSLRDNILFYLIGVIVLPSTLYMLLTYTLSFEFIKNYIIELNRSTFSQTLENINYYLDLKVKVLSGIVFDSSIQNYLSGSGNSSSSTEFKEGQTPVDDIINKMDSYIRLHDGKDEIDIYSAGNRLLLKNNITPSSDTGISPAVIDSLLKSSNIFSWQPTVIDPYNRALIDLAVKINSTQDYKPIGYLKCRFPEYYLESIYKNTIKDDINVFIVNEGDIILSHPNKNMINTRFLFSSYRSSGTDFMSGREEFLFRTKLKDVPWYLVAQYKNSIYLKDTRQFIYDRIYIMLLLLFITIIIAYMISGNFTSSIDKMNRLIKAMGIGNMELIFPEESPIHEISELGSSFNEMAFRIENLVDQLLISVKKQSELETREKEAEMIALQAQINPHFLYNTFESINALIQMDDKQKAIKMITALSDMLRFVAASGNTAVSISEELLYVETYVKIMKMRFGDRLSLTIHSDGSILSCKTIKLILQPIIENAIYHGIVPLPRPGAIRVNCSARGDDIFFLIYDNGKGMDPEALEQLNHNLTRKHNIGKIGLYNVQNRIRLFYGDSYGLRVESKPGGGTMVEIRIPRSFDM